MQRISGLLVVGMTAVALAAGCGGDDDSGSSATTDWANGVCEAISTWGDSVKSTGESLRSGATNADDLREAVDEFEQATRTFVDDLRKLGKPDTEAGDKAQEEIEQLADDVDENVSKMKDAADEASGASGILEAATTISGTLSTMGQQLSSTFAELEQLDAEGELDQAFRDADACDELSDEGSGSRPRDRGGPLRPGEAARRLGCRDAAQPRRPQNFGTLGDSPARMVL